MLNMYLLIVDSLFDGNKFLNNIKYVLIENDIIKAVGGNEVLELAKNKSNNLQKLDFRGKTVLPGFIDGHAHFLQMGIGSLQIDASAVSSKADFLELLYSEASKKLTPSVIFARDWDESVWHEKNFPERKDFDKISKTIPIIARRVCGHLAIANSAAMKLISRKNFKGDFSRGIAKEHSAWKFDENLTFSKDMYAQALSYAEKDAFSKGVTTVHEIIPVRFFQIYQQFLKTNKLNIRIIAFLPLKHLTHYIHSGLEGGFGSKQLIFGGVKIFMDGSIGAKTAALRNPYTDSPGNRGISLYSLSQLKKTKAIAEKNNIPLIVHAIGDRAITAAVKALASPKGTSDNLLRHRIEHLEIIYPKLLEEFAKSGVIASMQPNFARRWSIPNGMNWQRLGKKRVKWCNPYSKIVQNKIKLSFGSDCMPFGPLYGLEGAINHPIPELSISLQDALKAYTYGSAFAGGIEKWTGSIAVGKKADIAVLNRNIQNSSSLISVKVNTTFLNGKILYKKS